MEKFLQIICSLVGLGLLISFATLPMFYWLTML